MAVGAPTSDTRGRNGADRAAVSILLQPRNRCLVASRHHDRPRARRSRIFSRAVVAPHRAVTTVRCAGLAAPRCGSRRTCRTAARCSASSSPSAFASVRRPAVAIVQEVDAIDVTSARFTPTPRLAVTVGLHRGFDWVKTISPMLSKAGEGPVMWCPAVHKSDLHAIDV